MKKTMEQIVLEGQVSKCGSMEELFLLWELMQQLEERPQGMTCHDGIDPRSFHIDGILSPEQFNGVLYILKETNMRQAVRKGQTAPVISDVRGAFLSGKSQFGEVEFLPHLKGMQAILSKREKEPENTKYSSSLKEAAVIYINKRGGLGAADEISMNYGNYYIEWIRRQIQLIAPRVIVCCGEDIFRLIVMEVFRNKKEKKNRETYMKWKNVIQDDVFFAGADYRPAKTKAEAAVRVLRMWSPAYRVNNGQYVTLEEYLQEFERRTDGWEKS